MSDLNSILDSDSDDEILTAADMKKAVDDILAEVLILI